MKHASVAKEVFLFFRFRGLRMPKCRSPPFLPEKQSVKRNGGLQNEKRILSIVGGQKVKVSEDIYKVYWREREHEKYLEQVDRKNHLLFFRPWIRMDILQIISLMKVLMSKRLWSVWYCYNEKRGENH